MRATTLDAFQEMDQVAIMKPVVKAAYRVDMASRIPEYISVAFREALDAKKGPVYLDLPGDILNHKVDDEKLMFPANYRVDSRPAGDPVQVERAIELLAGAERPIVVTGSGVLWSGASAELRDFIDSTGLPFYTTPQGRGVIPEDHPRSFPGASDGARAIPSPISGSRPISFGCAW